MSKSTGAIRLTGLVLALSLLISSCGIFNRTTRIGDIQTENQTVELGPAAQARVQIRMGAGELSVAGGNGNLMDASFRYNVAGWQPRVNYTVNGSQGELVIDHPGEALPIGGSLINEWTLLLSNAVPIDLDIETGAGMSVLDLRGLDLTGLRIDMGAGNTNIDLSSALDHDLTVVIRGGVGELSVKLPGEMGVRVSADTGIGNLTNTGLVQDGSYFVNDVYGSSQHSLFLDIETGVGAIELLAP